MSNDVLEVLVLLAAGAFGLCLYYRAWWLAAVVTVGLLALFARDMPLSAGVFLALVFGVSAFAGAALGKFLKHRNRDPFDPMEPRT